MNVASDEHPFVDDSNSELEFDVESDDNWSDHDRQGLDESQSRSIDSDSSDSDSSAYVVTNQGDRGGRGSGHGGKRRRTDTSTDWKWKNVTIDTHLNGQPHEACLTDLPWNIRDSVCLYEVMTVAFNALTELPVELPLRLPHLSHLDLSHNQIASLPESFGLFFHLREIQLQHNKLNALPDSFVHLVKLAKIDLSFNELRSLHKDMGSMESLTRLNVVHNKLEELPVSLGDPSCPIKVLLTQQNRLARPPQAVCNEGSQSTLQYLRKLHSSMKAEIPAAPLNKFPRYCANRPERGVNNPHSAQIQYIQEQTNTSYTTNKIKAPLLPPLDATAHSPFQLRDKIIGLIFGAAIGDAIGVACRWMSDDEIAFYFTMDDDLIYDKIVQDEHRILWRQGDWTSNFDQFMLILESLVSWGGVVDELEFARRLKTWIEQGFKELGDSAGVVTSDTLQKVAAHSLFTQDPHSASHNTVEEMRAMETNSVELASPSDSVYSSLSPSSTPQIQLRRLSSASSSLSSLSLCGHVEVAQRLVYVAPYSVFGVDNAAVVRTPILGVPNFHDLSEVEGNAVRICKTTHSDSKCVASCVLVSLIISLLLQGKKDGCEGEDCVTHQQLDEIFQMASAHHDDEAMAQEFLALKQNTSLSSFNARKNQEMSHAYQAVQTALVALFWKEDYRSLVTSLTKMGGDSSSNACVAGAVLGCRVGFSNLPAAWLEGLRKRQVTWLNTKINHLLDIMGSP